MDVYFVTAPRWGFKLHITSGTRQCQTGWIDNKGVDTFRTSDLKDCSEFAFSPDNITVALQAHDGDSAVSMSKFQFKVWSRQESILSPVA